MYICSKYFNVFIKSSYIFLTNISPSLMVSFMWDYFINVLMVCNKYFSFLVLWTLLYCVLPPSPPCHKNGNYSWNSSSPSIIQLPKLPVLTPKFSRIPPFLQFLYYTSQRNHYLLLGQVWNPFFSILAIIQSYWISFISLNQNPICFHSQI